MVGEKEKMTNGVNVRTRDNKVHGELSVAEVMARLTLLKQSRCPNAEEEFWSRQRTTQTLALEHLNYSQMSGKGTSEGICKAGIQWKCSTWSRNPTEGPMSWYSVSQCDELGLQNNFEKPTDHVWRVEKDKFVHVVWVLSYVKVI